MAKSIALAADPSRLASLLLSYIQAVCAFVAPRQPGASPAIIDRLSHSRALSLKPARLAVCPRPTPYARGGDAKPRDRPVLGRGVSVVLHRVHASRAGARGSRRRGA